MPTPHTTLLSLFSGFSEGLVVMEKHGKPVEEMECACCYDDITAENYIEYRTGEGKLRLALLYVAFEFDGNWYLQPLVVPLVLVFTVQQQQ